MVDDPVFAEPCKATNILHGNPQCDRRPASGPRESCATAGQSVNRTFTCRLSATVPQANSLGQDLIFLIPFETGTQAWGEPAQSHKSVPVKPLAGRENPARRGFRRLPYPLVTDNTTRRLNVWPQRLLRLGQHIEARHETAERRQCHIGSVFRRFGGI